MTNGGSIVGLTFDGRFAWPVYDWMGVAKAAVRGRLAATLRATSAPQGIRCNLVSAGPLKTTAAKHIPGFDQMESQVERARAARLGLRGHRARGQGRDRAAQRLVPRHDRRDDSRRRWRPRDGAVVPLLVLVRHAKAEAPQAGLDDHARALTLEGREAAARLAERLVEAGIVPDLALVSSSNRTLQTFKRMATVLGDTPMRVEDDLYESAGERYLSVLTARR